MATWPQALSCKLFEVTLQRGGRGVGALVSDQWIPHLRAIPHRQLFSGKGEESERGACVPTLASLPTSLLSTSPAGRCYP